jgi:AmmeMemoRadiSam system protein A
VPISEKARALARVSPFVGASTAHLPPPGEVAVPLPALPTTGQDPATACDPWRELPLPPCLRALRHFNLLPIVLGEVDAEQVARALAGWIDEKTLVIAASELSDSQLQAEASGFRLESARAQAGSGKQPLRVLLHLARLQGWEARRIACNDAGHMAMVFHLPQSRSYSSAERKRLLELARLALQEAVLHGALPQVQPETLPPSLLEIRACFVTLTEHGRLRGCIGHLAPQEALYRAVMENARNAALRDSRFPPVQPAELDGIRIEISVLTEPQPLEFTSPEDLLSKLQAHQDGVILHLGDRRATFLPQVWEQLPDKVLFLNRLAQKAGCGPSDWRLPGTKVETYRVEAFHEED